MIEIGGRPTLLHIIEGSGAYGIDDFVICFAWVPQSVAM
jgi:NDP-sugar pyrophosphorylase family protein